MTQKSAIQHGRNEPYLIYFSALSGVTCERCGSGEVRSPMQTCAFPMVNECLRCGHIMESTPENPL